MSVMDEVRELNKRGLLSDEAVVRLEKHASLVKKAVFGFGGNKAVEIISRKAARKLAPKVLRNNRQAVDMAYDATAANPALRQSKDMMRDFMANYHHATDPYAKDVNRLFSGKVVDRLLTPARDAGSKSDSPSIMGRLAGLGTLGIGAVAAEEGYDRFRAHQTRNGLIEVYPELQQEDPEKVDRAYSMLEDYAPALTRNPHVAGSAVMKFMQFDVADPATIKTLVDIQKSTESPMRNLVRSAGAIGADVGL